MKKIIFISLLLLVSAGCKKSFESANSGSLNSISSLPPNHPPTEPTSGKAVAQTRMGNRFYIANVLKEIFTTPAGTAVSDNAVKTILQNMIINNPHLFGGTCSDYDPASCQANASIDHQSVANFSIDAPTRSAVLINACTEITETPGVLAIVESKSGLTGVQNPTLTQISVINELFYPHQNSASGTLALSNLFNKVKAASNRNDALKTIVYTLCTSPDWTVL